MLTADLVHAVDRPLYEAGASWYFTAETIAVGREHGLGGMRWYFLGRGGVLGDVDAAVVTSAFGYFKHSLVQKMWDSSRDKMDPRLAGRRYLQCAADCGRLHLGGVEGLEEFCVSAEAVVAAADPAALALFAGIAAEPLPEDLPGRALQLCAVLRELRGSVHLVAIVAAGLSPKLAHQLRRPADFTWFGWTDEEAQEVTERHRGQLDAADVLTEALLIPAWSVLDGALADRFVATLGAIHAALPPLG